MKNSDEGLDALVETITEVTAGAVKVAVPVALAVKMGSKRLPWLAGTAVTASFAVDEVEAHWERGDTCKAFGAALAGTAETGGNLIPGGNYLFLGDAFHKAVREAYIGVTEGLFGFDEGQCTLNETDVVAASRYLFSDNAQSMGIAYNPDPIDVAGTKLSIDERFAP